MSHGTGGHAHIGSERQLALVLQNAAGRRAEFEDQRQIGGLGAGLPADAAAVSVTKMELSEPPS